jgi:imidazolonepropionase-like amidohydrolase
MISPGAVLVDDDTITAVGSPDPLTMLVRHDAVHLTYPHATVVPGLIDAHVHLAFTGGRDPLTALNSLDREGLLEVMAGHARQLLSAGVTTVRDLGDWGYLAADLRDRIAIGQLLGPRILTSGAPLTPPDGHCWFLGGTVASADDIRATIASHANHGVDWIKVMASGGNLTPGSARIWEVQFIEGELQLIVDEARARGLPVAAHAHSAAAIQIATRAGVASIEHCRWLTSANFADADLDEATARVIASKGISVAPTIGTIWQQNEQRFPGWGMHMNRLLRWHDRHGIRLMHSTDAGVASSPYDQYSQHNSVVALGNAGFSNARILDILTRETAMGLGLSQRIGSLGHGYSADLVVLDGNPLDDLGALRRPLLVMARGRY